MSDNMSVCMHINKYSQNINSFSVSILSIALSGEPWYHTCFVSTSFKTDCPNNNQISTKFWTIDRRRSLLHSISILKQRPQCWLVWISICKENHALRAWREINWYICLCRSITVLNIVLNDSFECWRHKFLCVCNRGSEIISVVVCILLKIYIYFVVSDAICQLSTYSRLFHSWLSTFLLSTLDFFTLDSRLLLSTFTFDSRQLLSTLDIYSRPSTFRPRLHEPGMIFSPGW